MEDVRVYFPSDWAADDRRSMRVGEGVRVGGADLSGATVEFAGEATGVVETRFAGGLRDERDSPGTLCAVFAAGDDGRAVASAAIPGGETVETVLDPVTRLSLRRRRRAPETLAVDAAELAEAIQAALRGGAPGGGEGGAHAAGAEVPAFRI